MSKKIKWTIIILSALLVLELGAAFGVVGYWKPWAVAVNTMPETGLMVMTRGATGKTTLAWPAGKEQDRYLVRVMRGQEMLIQRWTTESSCTLPPLPEGENLDILISTAKGYRFPFAKEERIRMGEQDLKATVNFKMPSIENLKADPDPVTQTVTLRFDLDENSVCRMYHEERGGDLTELQSLEQGEVTLTMGDDGDYPVPQRGEELVFAFDTYRFSPGLVYYGAVTEQISIVREDLLDRELALECTDLGNNVYSFTWDETKGNYYEVQHYDTFTESWKPLTQVKQEEERSYTTGHLDRHTDYRFRVVAVGGQTMPGSDLAAVSQEVSITTGNTAVFTTIWPIQELKLYKDVDKAEVIGKAKAVKALCVLDEKEGLFRVRIDGQEGYIDSNYCLINLPEYLGDLCLYNITNSQSSLFMAHEYELPTITGQVLPGYERVQLRRGQHLVPLLYPVAKRLEKAAQSAISQGYKLKIYDGYRPQKATKALYDQVLSLQDLPIPDTTYTGKVMVDLPQLEEGQVLTYGDLMTDRGRYTLKQILEGEKSRLNQGVALNLTLADRTTIVEQPMPTSMHDLSGYSETSNNANAQKLASIMKEAGFTAQKSQWWYFYDQQTQNTVNPKYQNEGVLPECWMADDRGWRYRRDDGEYYVNCTEIIDGVSCTFDEQGYLVTVP